MNLSILYRGPLSSCNYGCEYCPFAKRTEGAAELAHDRESLARFVGRIRSLDAHTFGVLFTPWGEALVRRWYQEALGELSRLPNVVKAAIQTNLSCKLDWVTGCDLTKLALWCTYHPGEVDRARFVAKCQELSWLGVRYSVGIVGLREHRAEAEALREALPAGVYMWVNAYKREPDYYDPELWRAFESIDPLFPVNARHHESLGGACRAGHQTFTVDGDGVMRRCHFIDRPVGNLYEDGFESGLKERPCTNATCGCHIGYVHLDRLGLYEVYGDGVLERVPARRG